MCSRSMLQHIALMMALLCASGAVADSVTEPFQGVRYTRREVTVPRRIVMYIVEIDLANPFIRFRTTESNGDLPRETTLETTRAFITRIGAQIGINGNWYDADSNYADLIGLAVSDGDIVSAYRPTDPRQSFNISIDNVPAMFHDPAPIPLWNAATGYRILRDGTTHQTNQDGSLNPRTGIGYTPDGRLILLIVDGRTTASGGMTTLEMNEVFLEFGATNAINLDGGGSTTLAFADPTPRVVNVPSDRFLWMIIERKNGNNLGLFALKPHENGVTVSAQAPVLHVPTGEASFIIRRTGSTAQPLTVHFDLGGTAISGVHYTAIPEAITIPAGSTDVEVAFVLNQFPPEPTLTVELALLPDTSYHLGRNDKSAEISIVFDWPVPGDANGDCRVDLLDLMFVRTRMAEDAGIGDNWQADVNGDGVINMLDLIYVRNRLGNECH